MLLIPYPYMLAQSAEKLRGSRMHYLLDRALANRWKKLYRNLIPTRRPPPMFLFDPEFPVFRSFGTHFVFFTSSGTQNNEINVKTKVS